LSEDNTCDCVDGHFPNDLTMKCEVCDFKCKECNNSFECTECAENRIGAECSCPTKHYSIEGDPLCHPCDYTCNECTGGDAN